MTAEEQNALPSLTPDLIAWGGISGVAQRSQERTAALDKWKAENPERYQEGLRAQEQAASGQPQRTQTASNARQGAGGSGGGAGASSANTLLTGAGATQGVDPAALDLSKNTLLGL
ncbi:hypothetical protein [Achromobacter insolitus]|uniref:hypothetical protein n=1 Tax=Achromobacter insolitus TaxID=217204 RepID=UPI001042576F|nr:hypothetical protein [Achromobacter insolitus]